VFSGALQYMPDFERSSNLLKKVSRVLLRLAGFLWDVNALWGSVCAHPSQGTVSILVSYTPPKGRQG